MNAITHDRNNIFGLIYIHKYISFYSLKVCSVLIVNGYALP